MMKKKFIDILNDAHEKDVRRDKNDFLNVFDLYFYLNDQEIMRIIKDGAEEQCLDDETYELLANCLSVYQQHVIDYHDLTPQKLREAKRQYNVEHDLAVTDALLGHFLGLTRGVISVAESRFSGRTIDCYETLKFDFVQFPWEKCIFSNVQARWALDALIMRAQVGEGTNPRSIDDIAQETQISTDILRHPEKACKNELNYLRVLDALRGSISEYRLVQHF